MSEFQNRAIELLVARSGSATVMDAAERRVRFLENALELFRAMGGELDEVCVLAEEIYARPTRDVVEEIGDVMIALAGVSQFNDVDMMQAAYNILDAEWKTLAPAPDNANEATLYTRSGGYAGS